MVYKKKNLEEIHRPRNTVFTFRSDKTGAKEIVEHDILHKKIYCYKGHGRIPGWRCTIEDAPCEVELSEDQAFSVCRGLSSGYGDWQWSIFASFDLKTLETQRTLEQNRIKDLKL